MNRRHGKQLYPKGRAHDFVVCCALVTVYAMGFLILSFVVPV